MMILYISKSIILCVLIFTGFLNSINKGKNIFIIKSFIANDPSYLTINLLIIIDLTILGLLTIKIMIFLDSNVMVNDDDTNNEIIPFIPEFEDVFLV